MCVAPRLAYTHHAEPSYRAAVQLADMTVELLEADRRVSEAEAAAAPEVVHLRALHTDPAIAREFAELRAAARKLAEEKKHLTDTVQGLAFKAGDQVRGHPERHKWSRKCSCTGTIRSSDTARIMC